MQQRQCLRRATPTQFWHCWVRLVNPQPQGEVDGQKYLQSLRTKQSNPSPYPSGMLRLHSAFLQDTTAMALLLLIKCSQLTRKSRLFS
ncbi:hypothetical protein [Nostoc sp.]